VNVPTRDQLAALPKVELHVHLEGSIRADTAIELARRHGEDPDEALVLEDGRYPARFRDFMHFVDTFVRTSRQVRTPDDLCTVAADFAAGQAAQNVVYTEATFTAVTLIDNGWRPDVLWQALIDGFASQPETDVRLLVDAVRDAGPDHAERTVAAVEEGLAAGAPIVGFGLAGIEGSYPERDFRMLRDAADRLGIGLAVHAGETGTPDNVRAALDDLGADRIGHGIAVVRDPDLMARVADAGVPFEVCPSSNVTLGLVDEIPVHPVRAMYDAGVAVTIGSDDPPFFDTTLTDELWRVAELLRLDLAQVVELQRRAAGAAFVSDERRAALLAAIEDA
jgi:aminodeoxyfutalosine deaminase